MGTHRKFIRDGINEIKHQKVHKKSLAKMFNIIFEFQGMPHHALPTGAHVIYYIIKLFLVS